jgi:hypothetical protein
MQGGSLRPPIFMPPIKQKILIEINSKLAHKDKQLKFRPGFVDKAFI